VAGDAHPPTQTGCFPVNSGASFGSSTAIRLLGADLVCRILLVAILAAVSHQFEWEWLRFLTSEAVLRLSASLGMVTERVSFDTISIQREFFRFVISCTFVDVFIGAIPLVWDLKKSISGNFLTLIALAAGLFGFNALRLEAAQLFHACGVPWIAADEILGGFAYFGAWLFVSRWLGISRLIGYVDTLRLPRIGGHLC
jgi:hypothetical protein